MEEESVSEIEKKLGEELFDAIDYYANSAAVLYGVVTLEELEELMARYRPECKIGREDLVAALAENAKFEETSFFLFDNCVCHVEFDCGKDTPEVIDGFLDERQDKPRWYPEDEDAFFNFCEDSAFLETDEAIRFSDFLEKHGPTDERELDTLLFDIVYMHQHGEAPTRIISETSAKCKLETKSEGVEFVNLLMTFLNGMHLRSNNGWTPDEFFKKFSTPIVNEHPKIGRNDPCPCGSGKKYKKCCGRGGASE